MPEARNTARFWLCETTTVPRAPPVSSPDEVSASGAESTRANSSFCRCAWFASCRASCASWFCQTATPPNAAAAATHAASA